MAVGISQAFFGSSHLISVKIFPDLLNAFGFSGTFLFYTCICAMMTAWAGVFMTNVDGLSLVEVEKMFEGKKKDKKPAPLVRAMTDIALATTK